jgi:hypothetical protein
MQVAQLLGLVSGVAALLGELLADPPKELFGGGAIAQIEVTEIEERDGLLLLSALRRGSVRAGPASGLLRSRSSRSLTTLCFSFG